MVGVCRGLNCTVNRNVAGSSPARGAKLSATYGQSKDSRLPTLLVNSAPKELVRGLRAKLAAVALALQESAPRSTGPSEAPFVPGLTTGFYFSRGSYVVKLTLRSLSAVFTAL